MLWQLRFKEHQLFLMILMYCYFLVASIATYRYFSKIRPFQRTDLGLLQVWIMVLLVSLLVCLDDPLQIVHYYAPFALYSIIASVLQATFVALLMFFWLVAIHSISLSNLITVD